MGVRGDCFELVELRSRSSSSFLPRRDLVEVVSQVASLLTGIQYWLAQGVSLVFVTLTLAEPLPYPEVAENWRVFKQAFARMVAKRPGSIGGIAFARVFERQEKRFERTGQTAVHLHALVAGVQYRGDRLGGKARRKHFRKAEELGLTGAVVTKKELQELADKYGFGPMLDITQVQASPENPGSAYDVAKYLAKYLSKFEALAQWLPKGKQVIAGSQGKLSWAGPGVTRGWVRKERLERALARREADRADQAPTQPIEDDEAAQTLAPEPEQMELPIPWPPPLRRRR